MDAQTINIIAIFSSPILAVLITLWYQERKEKYQNKLNLFYTLMAHRKSIHIDADYVKALNLIDVFYAKDTDVLKLWHEYYDLLHTRTTDYELWEHKKLDLIQEMASSLGYKDLKQTDIDKFYTPTAHGNQMKLNEEIQSELLRVLRNTSSIAVKKKEDNKIN